MSVIHLSCGKTSAVIRKMGAQMISFKGEDGREVMWQGDAAVWEDTSPVLFPVCGSPVGRQVTIDGRSYPMPQHGFASRCDFEVFNRGDNFVDLILIPNEECRACYPFEFIFHVIFTLRENGFSAEYLVENNGNTVLPFCVGAHPGFNVPMEDGAGFTDYQLVFPDDNQGRNLLVTEDGLIDGEELIVFEYGNVLPLHHGYFDQKDSLVFVGMKSRQVKLTNKNTGKGVCVKYPQMEVLVIWSMPVTHGDYVCIEPWHGMPGQVTESGKFEDKPYVTLLQPGQSHQCGYDVELI